MVKSAPFELIDDHHVHPVFTIDQKSGERIYPDIPDFEDMVYHFIKDNYGLDITGMTDTIRLSKQVIHHLIYVFCMIFHGSFINSKLQIISSIPPHRELDQQTLATPAPQPRVRSGVHGGRHGLLVGPGPEQRVRHVDALQRLRDVSRCLRILRGLLRRGESKVEQKIMSLIST